MCGIWGFIGSPLETRKIYAGLKKLEYRGYDSAGLALLEKGESSLIKAAGKLSSLEEKLAFLPEKTSLGMGHTRWATHGVATEVNAHPHHYEGFTLVHNGIIENYLELKKELPCRGESLLSQTDSEVVLHLIVATWKKTKDISKALQQVVTKLKGSFALSLFSNVDPEHIYLLKKSSPLVLGLGKERHFFSSDPIALLQHTKEFIYLEDGEQVRLGRANYEIQNQAGTVEFRKPLRIELDEEAASKKTYRHYMLKEIYEQPEIVLKTLKRFFVPNELKLDPSTWPINRFDKDYFDRIHIIACGSAYYAGLMGQYLLEEACDLPVTVELASEFRYRKPFVHAKTLVMAISQSGETADTLASLEYAKAKGAQTLALCNSPRSAIDRTATQTLLMQAGPEIGVASTKAFMAMAVNLYFLALSVESRRKKEALAQKLSQLQSLPTLLQTVLEQEEKIKELAKSFAKVDSCLFLGRGISYPIALEGALKLKEISYIHAEGYAGGELKHGPIALIEDKRPIIAIVTQDAYRDKMLANLEEVAARKGQIIIIGPQVDSRLKNLAHSYFELPFVEDTYLQALLACVVTQLFSYHVALHLGHDIDQPRNLAKSVTVE